jgi:4-amino-4-deoxy-L-arabinose transferase-like glycosyltransferase
MNLEATGKRVRASTSSLFFTGVALFIILAHAPFWNLPYYWDELGQFVPAALDIFQTGSWIPHSTVPNVHPPGVTAYLAGVWLIAGYSIMATRLAMLMLAAAAAIFTNVLALRLGTNAGEAALAVAFLTLSPLFFAQSMMAELDMPAMLLTVLALILFLDDRIVAAAMASVALVMVKETGLVVPAIFGAFLWFEKRRRDALWFLLPLVPLGLWLLALNRVTGHLFGNAAFTEYNVFYPLHPVRLGLALARRLYFLFGGTGHWIGFLAVIYALRCTKLFRTRAWRVAAWIFGVHVLLVSVLGGAVLERYLLPVLPFVYIAFAQALWTYTARWRIASTLALGAALVIANFVNPPYPFPWENNLAFTDFVNLHAEAAHYLESHYPDKTVATMFPLSSALRRPEFGYVSRPVRVREVYDYRASNIAPLARENIDVVVLYSVTWDPWGLMDQPSWIGLLKRYYGYVDPVKPDELRALLGVRLVYRWQRHGQWVEIYSR